MLENVHHGTPGSPYMQYITDYNSPTVPNVADTLHECMHARVRLPPRGRVGVICVTFFLYYTAFTCNGYAVAFRTAHTNGDAGAGVLC